MSYDIPFVPSSDDAVQTMLGLASVREGEKAIDLGCGDGKLVVALAEAGADVTGVEIDEERSGLARGAILEHNLPDKARVINGNFWRQDLKDYDLIVLYGVPSIMERLKKKILNEAKLTCRIVSNHFKFPQWEPRQAQNSVYLYQVGDAKT